MYRPSKVELSHAKNKLLRFYAVLNIAKTAAI